MTTKRVTQAVTPNQSSQSKLTIYVPSESTGAQKSRSQRPAAAGRRA
jgi:hypothetical protein